MNSHKYHYTYQTICEINGKSYIGVHSTNNLDDGYIGCGIYKQSHACRNNLFHKAVRKYGYINFRKYILSFYDSRNDAMNEERFLVTEKWVKEKSNYNASIGGSGGMVYLSKEDKTKAYRKVSEKLTGRKHSEETKRKISAVHKGRKLSEEHKMLLKKNHLNWFKGRKHKQESIEKMKLSAANRPKISEETRIRLSKAKLGKPSPKRKQVIQIEPNGNIVSCFSSIKEASIVTGILSSVICNILTGKTKKCRQGYAFKYKQCQ